MNLFRCLFEMSMWSLSVLLVLFNFGLAAADVAVVDYRFERLWSAIDRWYFDGAGDVNMAADESIYVVDTDNHRKTRWVGCYAPGEKSQSGEAYQGFDVAGEYEIAYYVKNSSGLPSSPMPDSVTRYQAGGGTDERDKYENDDTQAEAGIIWSVHPGTLLPGLLDTLGDVEIPQIHTIHAERDEDWVAFQAQGNVWHEIQALPMSETLDLKIELYDESGLLLHAADWNFQGDTEVLDYYLAGATRRLWIRVRAMAYEDIGKPQAYKLFVWQPYLEFDGFVHGVVTAAATGLRLARAVVTSAHGSTVATDPKGVYVMPHVAGVFDFTATAPPPSTGAVTASVEINKLKDTKQDFEVPIGGDDDPANRLPPGTQVTISGRVRDPSGTPLCAMVLANGEYIFSCDGQGSYALTLTPGRKRRGHPDCVRRRLSAV